MLGHLESCFDVLREKLIIRSYYLDKALKPFHTHLLVRFELGRGKHHLHYCISIFLEWDSCPKQLPKKKNLLSKICSNKLERVQKTNGRSQLNTVIRLFTKKHSSIRLVIWTYFIPVAIAIKIGTDLACKGPGAYSRIIQVASNSTPLRR